VGDDAIAILEVGTISKEGENQEEGFWLFLYWFI